MVVTFNTDVLNGLCSEDQLELLDAVDQLRLQGIDHYISLPQIIVCGDQSSGKSSVLEAISGVPFPVKSNLCTRFPTELILRRSPSTDVTVSIIPHTSLTGEKKKTLSAFHEKLNGFEGVPELIESAKVAMGISMQGKGFSKDLLRIEISGPHHPHLTIVDLPGLIHSETRQQSTSDVELVRDVVQTYMKQPRSIILAVISAKNDFANQIVLKLAQTIDPSGKRTMGVITKPDTLVEGSGSEAMFVSLAENKEIEFSLGWHVLRNLDSEKIEGSSLLHRRNEEEAIFFSEGVWSRLSSSKVGVKELRTRLSDVLLQQVATELPSLIMEIDNKLQDCTYHLDQMGEPRTTVYEQRRFLAHIGQRFEHLIHDIKNGIYTGTFFDEADTERGYEQRLRAVIQRLNEEFASEMSQRGRARHIRSAGERMSPNTITRDQFIEEIKELMWRTRGRELPGRFNSFIVTDLFLKQSKPWRDIVINHVENCWVATKRCLKLAIESFADGRVGTNVFRNVIVPALGNLRSEIVLKASELIDSQVLCHPVTYNEQYLEQVHRINDQRRGEYYTQIVRDTLGYVLDGSSMWVEQSTVDSLIQKLSQRREPDAEQRAASEAADCMEAYYNVALKRIVDDVAIEVIERKLIAALPAIFSPLVVLEMPADLVSAIAGESQETRDERTKLENQVKILNKGSETCKRFAGPRLAGLILPLQGDEGDTEDNLSATLDDSEVSILEQQPGGWRAREAARVAERAREAECSDGESVISKRSKKRKQKQKKKGRHAASMEAVAAPEVQVM
ncbi:P-loop containing nucleoside triphosphate hydrolase protein [Xylaria sp. FL0933]|nr:P-loop containing nucleoside triphosphate hydrolase protein [Xylaria sp. FL0933]